MVMFRSYVSLPEGSMIPEQRTNDQPTLLSGSRSHCSFWDVSAASQAALYTFSGVWSLASKIICLQWYMAILILVRS